MTEKRFVYYEHKGADYILDTPNKSLDFIEMLGDCLEAEEIVDLLNELHDENQLLHKINEDTIDFMYDNFDLNIIFTDRELNDITNEMGWELSEKGIKIKQLEKENKQLKQSYNITDLETQIMKLKEENKNLKQALWEAEEGYLHEIYHDPIRLQDKIINLKEDWDKEYWND